MLAVRLLVCCLSGVLILLVWVWVELCFLGLRGLRGVGII